MTTTEIRRYRRAVEAMSDAELENERFTLTHERSFLALSDADVADRLAICEVVALDRANS